jgi:hypothetical protein
VSSRGLYAAGPALALPAERAAMRVRGPRLEIELRVIRWVAEEVVDERHPGAQAGLGRLEHMFETLGGGSDGMGARLQGKTGVLHNAGEAADGALHNAAGRVDLGWPRMRIGPGRGCIGPREDAHRPWPRTRIGSGRGRGSALARMRIGPRRPAETRTANPRPDWGAWARTARARHRRAALST